MDCSKIIAAKSWRALGVPKTKEALRDLQRKTHPDVNKDPQANNAFAKLSALYEGPDYDLRVAKGTSTNPHYIVWEMKPDFLDRDQAGYRALGKLNSLSDDRRRFFPNLVGYGANSVSVGYGEGWWFLDDFPILDSRTSVWVAKRAAAAIVIASDLGLVHGDINSKTVVLLPSEHGLMLDGWWSSVHEGDRLVIKPDAPTPAKYLGGAAADQKLMVAQLAAMLTKHSQPDKLLAETYKKYSLGVGNATEFFDEVTAVSEKLYGPPKWHPVDSPSIQMI